MTIEMQYAIASMSDDEEDTGDNCRENEENMSPAHDSNNLMVAIKPSNIYELQKINNKIVVSTPIKTLVFGEEDGIPISEIIPSPVKRPSSDNTNNYILGAPLSKRPTSSPSYSDDSFSSISTPTCLLSQSAGAANLKPEMNNIRGESLSQSCFADIHTKKYDTDTDLTCLSWLQDGNLLKGFSPGSNKDHSVEEKSPEENEDLSDLQLNSTDPLHHASNVDKSIQKPPYSFSALIFMAIESTDEKCMPVKDIYQWIQDNFPYFEKAPIGWKNSVRHNLSLNKSFRKDILKRSMGKGSLWSIDHEARAGLVQQLRKTTAYNSYPYTKTSFSQNIFSKDKNIYKRDAAGRFLPNHDDKEFDVAAAMCSLSAPTIYKHYEQKARQSGKIDHAINLNLLKIWRTYLEPFETNNETSTSSQDSKLNFVDTKINKRHINSGYSFGNFIDEVKNKLSFNPISPNNNKLINNSYDEDYEFDDFDESESEDDEMSENMKRLVDCERDDTLGDSGYSEEGTFKSAAVLDHSYSKPIHSLTKLNIKSTAENTSDQNKAVDGLLYLANAATKELEKISSSNNSVYRNDLVVNQHDLVV